MSAAKDLTKEAPASPRTRVGGYVILARMADKGRAVLQGTAGDYHFDCPLDNILFGFKGVKGDDVRQLLESGADNEAIAFWLDSSGIPKTREEIEAWSDETEAYLPFNNPEKKEWFVEVCAEAGIDPEESTLFDYLEADDRATFSK